MPQLRLHCLWLAVVLSACAFRRHDLELPQPAAILPPPMGDTALLVVATGAIGSYETFREYREDPGNVDLNGKAEYNLRLIDIGTRKFPGTEFAAVKAAFTGDDSMGTEEWTRLSSRLDAGKHPVIYLYGFRLGRERPTSLAVQDGIFNFTLAPILWVAATIGSAYNGFLTYTPFEHWARHTVIYTQDLRLRVWQPGEGRLSPPVHSRYIVQTEEGTLNKGGDAEDLQLKEIFRKASRSR